MGLFIQSSLGLDIGSHSIKLAEVKHTRAGPIITCAKAVQFAREQEEETGEYIEDIEVGEALRELLSKSKLNSKRVITAVSSALEEQTTILSSFFIPELVSDLPKEAIKSGVMMEADVQARIPFSADVAVADCDVLDEKTIEGRKGLEVFLVAAHRELIESRYQLLRSVGLIPIAIDVDFLALARLLRYTNQIPDDENIAIIDIGASKTSVGFYQHGKLHIHPHIPVGGNYLTDELSQELAVSWEEAEEQKKSVEWEGEIEEPIPSSDSVQPDSIPAEIGDSAYLKPEELSSDDTSEIIQRALENWEELYSQLQSRFDFYEADFPEFKLSKIFAAGGTSQLPNLDKFLAFRLSIPVENVNYLESIPVDAKGDVDEVEDNESLFATAVGLALKKKL